MRKNILSEEGTFLLENRGLKIRGNPRDLQKIKKDLEAEVGKVLVLTIDYQEGNYIEASLTL